MGKEIVGGVEGFLVAWGGTSQLAILACLRAVDLSEIVDFGVGEESGPADSISWRRM